MGGYKWFSSKVPGVRYREHPTRKHGIRPDRYFVIRYQADGRRAEEALGWASEGWSESRATAELAKLKEAARTGEGALTLKEKRELAEAKRKTEEAEKARQEIESLTFGRFFEETYLPQARRDKGRRSWQREESFFRCWLSPIIGHKPLTKIMPFDIEKIKRNMLEAERAPRSVEYCLAVVRQVFRRAHRDGLYQDDPPTTKVRKPRFDNRRMRFLSAEESGRLLAALANRSQDLADMARLSLDCGLRAGEVFGLVWSDIDEERGLIVLRDTKNTNTRHAYMTAPVRTMLARRVRGAPADLVFPARGGIRRDRVSKVFTDVVEDLGLNEGIDDPRQRLVFHSLRHSFAARLVETGATLFEVRELLGHKSMVMTARYSHVGQNALQDAVARMEAASKTAPAATVLPMKKES